MSFQLLPNLGARTWSGSRDRDGYRDYKIKFRMKGNTTDGPANALQCPGLPLPGTAWSMDDDVDDWAYCKLDATMTPVQGQEGDPTKYFDVEQTFSTKGDEKRCKDEQVDDPLLEPQKISGSFQKFTEEATLDRDGLPILNSAHERIRGQQNEWDANRPTIKVEQNVPLLEIELFAPMVDTLNDAPLWGFPARCIKLSPVPWERKFHGSCDLYYTRTFEFEIRVKIDPATREMTSGWDRDVMDEGTKCVRGHWNTDPHSATFREYIIDDDLTDAFGDLLDGVLDNPASFIKFKDFTGNVTRSILNGVGKPVNSNPSPIEAATNASPIVITESAHGRSENDRITIIDVIGNTAANGTWNITLVDSDKYKLDGSTGNGTYTPPVGTSPNNVGAYIVGVNRIEKYTESNFLLLSIPTTF